MLLIINPMKERPILSLYAYFICAICSCASIVCIYLILMSFTNIIFPDYISFDKLSKYRSLEVYRENNAKYKDLSDEKLMKIKEQKYSDALYHIKGDSIGSIIRCFIFLFVAVVFLYIHWRLAQSKGLVHDKIQKNNS